MTLPTIFNCLKYSTYEVPNPYGVSWSAYIRCLMERLPVCVNEFRILCKYPEEILLR